MTPSEWDEVRAEVEALWGRSAKWARHTDAVKYAQSIPKGAAMRAIETLYSDGEKTAPAPALVLSKARTYIDSTMAPDAVEQYCRRNGHLWGIVDEKAGLRTVLCGRCRSEEERPAHLAPTAGEIEDGVFSGKGDTDDEITERIAP